MGLVNLPNNVIEKMSPQDRKEYGLAVGHRNAGRTRSEIERDMALKAEKDLQAEIRQYLSLKEIVFINVPQVSASRGDGRISRSPTAGSRSCGSVKAALANYVRVRNESLHSWSATVGAFN
jgi:hypothetical protein